MHPRPRRREERRCCVRRSRDCAARVSPRRAKANERDVLDYSITIFPLFLFRRMYFCVCEPRGLGEEIISRARPRYGTTRRDATRRETSSCPVALLYKNRRAARYRTARAPAGVGGLYVCPSVSSPSECSIQNI